MTIRHRYAEGEHCSKSLLLEKNRSCLRALSRLRQQEKKGTPAPAGQKAAER
ncbi:MAG: hypothetical protein RR426_08885 [Oscillospiraceae bacterium]